MRTAAAGPACTSGESPVRPAFQKPVQYTYRPDVRNLRGGPARGGRATISRSTDAVHRVLAVGDHGRAAGYGLAGREHQVVDALLAEFGDVGGTEAALSGSLPALPPLIA